MKATNERMYITLLKKRTPNIVYTLIITRLYLLYSIVPGDNLSRFNQYTMTNRYKEGKGGVFQTQD